ncbi:MAG: hypothetical protein LR008_01575, partial [Candidatus Pacebacteria bacterium]|nr:hypothetical protein [Candidatus Paceibacterota bacterium]
MTFDQWMWFIHEKFKFKNGRTTLRIKLPQEVLKSPEAMESVLGQIHTTNSPYNLVQAYWEGKHSLVTSLELATVDGEVRFYANVPTRKVKNNIESQLYAQYPGIEITEELIDYTAEFKWDTKEIDMITFHIGKSDDEVLPIKTYIDMGMERLPKEEEKFEPMAPMLESISNVEPHERIWIQILMVPHAKKSFKVGSLRKIPTWEKSARAKINELMKRDRQGLGTEETESRPVLTLAERDTIASIERNVSKPAYKTIIRAMYITKAGKFNA